MFAPHNRTDGCLIHPVLAGESILTDAACRVSVADFIHLRLGKFGAWMRLPALFGERSADTSCPAFRIHVGDVVYLRAEKQMVWIAARRVVAVMQDFHAVLNRPIGQLPGDAVRDSGVPCSISTRTNNDHAVAERLTPALPFPTLIVTPTINLRPEAIFQRASLSLAGTKLLARFITPNAITVDRARCLTSTRDNRQPCLAGAFPSFNHLRAGFSRLRFTAQRLSDLGPMFGRLWLSHAGSIPRAAEVAA